ncbi:MAG TPA: nitroreductase family deazaflavin-dependent oxidoreductase [Candidatus Dormibacteraeota bacterium]|jgi:deazaflavin-dependent oxidoreductase (nitroreductase family)
MPMTPFDRQLGLRLLGLHQLVYDRSGGLIGHRLGSLKMLLLRTTGRKSGERRTAALLYLDDGQRYVVVGSKGGSDTPPAWLLNLEADPAVEVQVGTRRFPALARRATPAEHRGLWPKLTRLWPGYERYQSQTRRRIPLVILEPVAQASSSYLE